MKKPLLLFSLLLLFSSCSWETKFCIFNYSDTVVQVNYQINSLNSSSEFFNTHPKIYTANKIWDELNQTEIPAQDYHVDSITKTVTVNLQPNQAVYVGMIDEAYKPSNPEQRNKIIENVIQLTVIKSKDTLRCTRDMIPERFMKTKHKRQFGIYIH